MLPPEAQQVIQDEENALSQVMSSLERQLEAASGRLRTESERARELTSALVTTKRIEDKQLLASDEAVAHVLRDKKSAEMDGLKKLSEKPYFARIVVQEDRDRGPQKFEYRIGYKANTDCRIVDWRTAPLSKLYYEYQEGDEYSEEIQGQERIGKIILRNRLDIQARELKKITCRLGELSRTAEGWIQSATGDRGRVAGSYTRLPSVLSLITPDQFRLITSDADAPVFIQGIAGSGKTTVAIHRLAWLLHESNSPLRSERAVIVVQSPLLKSYIENSLPLLEVFGVEVLTFPSFLEKVLREILSSPTRPDTPVSSSIVRVKRSSALLRVLEETDYPPNTPLSYQAIGEVLERALSQTRRLIELDDTRLLDKEVIERARARTSENARAGVQDQVDDPLFLRIIQKVQKLPLSERPFEHIIVDEVQDFSAVDLAVLTHSVTSASQLTFVGDIGQRVDDGNAFPGWDKVVEYAGLAGAKSKLVSLEVSHRSTRQIMEFAAYIQGQNMTVQGRSGRVPIWFKCGKETQGIETALDWLQKALERYPSGVSAVLCRDAQEAKMTLSFLRPTFGHAVRLVDDDALSLAEGIVVAHTKQVKGLEFCNVLLWNPSRKKYGQGEIERNLLYVAATRAEENICLVTWETPSPFLPKFRSPLVRCYDLALDDEEG